MVPEFVITDDPPTATPDRGMGIVPMDDGLRAHETDPLDDQPPVHGQDARATLRPLFTRAPRDRKWLVSLTTALAVHGGVIALGVADYKTHRHDQPPQLVLPVGWATEFQGAGDPGTVAIFHTESPQTVDGPPITEEPPVKSILGPPPPTGYQPPVPTASAAAVDPNLGTGDAVVEGRTSDASPPLFPPRTPPGLAHDSGTPPPSAPAPEPKLASAGQSNTGSGASTGGGPQGVPDGMPVPSFKNRRPAYPDLALRNDWTGTVVVELDISANGRVTATRLVESSGHEVLDREAVDTAKTWKFTPATSNGQPVPITLRLPINYELDRRRRR